MANNRPWDFDEARAACRKASRAQEAAEQALKDAQRFADWSQRREMAETGHLEPIG